MRTPPTARRVLLSIHLEGFPTPPNASRRQFWAERSEEAAVWRNSAKLVAMQALREHEYPQDFPLRKATLELVVSGVDIDPDGCIGAVKPVLDGIVDAGVMRDDSWRTIDGLSVRRKDGPRGLRVDVIFGRPA